MHRVISMRCGWVVNFFGGALNINYFAITNCVRVFLCLLADVS